VCAACCSSSSGRSQLQPARYRSAATISYFSSNSGFPLGHKFKSHELTANPLPWNYTSFTDRPSVTYIYQIDMLVTKKLRTTQRVIRCTLYWSGAVFGQQGKKFYCFKQPIDRYVCLLQIEIYWPQLSTLQTA
jgi:hypothetical protein